MATGSSAASTPERRFTFQASELSIGPEVRSYLPAPLQVKYDQLEPEGKFKVDVEYNSAFEGVPIKLRELSLVDGSVRHELFPYRVNGVRGGVRQEGSRFVLDFNGQANGRPVTLKGVLGAMSPDASLDLMINVTQLPIDSELLRAFAESKQPALVKLHPVLRVAESQRTRRLGHSSRRNRKGPAGSSCCRGCRETSPAGR